MWSCISESGWVAPEPNSGCWLWTRAMTAAGYGLHKPYKGKAVLVHRLAWEIASRTAIPKKMHVCHRCNNPICCNPEHLFLGTHKDNMDHRDRCGRNPKGSKIGNSVLKEEDVIEIDRLLKSGWGQKIIADVFGVHQMTISDIKCRRSWGHLFR